MKSGLYPDVQTCSADMGAYGLSDNRCLHVSYWLCSNDKACTNQMFTEGQSDIVYAGDNSGGQDEVGWCFSCRVFSASQNLKVNLCLFLQKIAASEMLSVCLLIAGTFAASGPNAVPSAVSLPLVQIECSFEVGHVSVRGDVCCLFGSLVSIT